MLAATHARPEAGSPQPPTPSHRTAPCPRDRSASWCSATRPTSAGTSTRCCRWGLEGQRCELLRCWGTGAASVHAAISRLAPLPPALLLPKHSAVLNRDLLPPSLLANGAQVLVQAGAYVKDDACRALLLLVCNAAQLHGYAARAAWRALSANVAAAQPSLLMVATWCLGEKPMGAGRGPRGRAARKSAGRLAGRHDGVAGLHVAEPQACALAPTSRFPPCPPLLPRAQASTARRWWARRPASCWRASRPPASARRSWWARWRRWRRCGGLGAG